MKAEFKDGLLTLRAESPEENLFLNAAGAEGIRNFGSGSYNTLSLPSMANLTQCHLTQNQLVALLYALGKADADLRKVLETMWFRLYLPSW